MASPKLINLKGQRFGRLMVIERAENTKLGSAKWRCACDCGKQTVVIGICLRKGETQSCGCYNRERTSEANATHRMKHSPEYNSWRSMIVRCTKPTDKSYPNWGGRGITVCAEWRGSFETFYRDMGPRPGTNYSIDRIDNDRGYEPNNCRWSSPREQALNRRNTVRVEWNGKVMCLSEVALAEELPSQSLYRAYRRHGSVEAAVLRLRANHLREIAYKRAVA